MFGRRGKRELLKRGELAEDERLKSVGAERRRGDLGRWREKTVKAL